MDSLLHLNKAKTYAFRLSLGMLFVSYCFIEAIYVRVLIRSYFESDFNDIYFTISEFMLYASYLLAVLFTPLLVNYHERVPVIRAGYGFMLFGIAMSFVPFTIPFCLSSLFKGVACGILSSVIPNFISEIAPKHNFLEFTSYTLSSSLLGYVISVIFLSLSSEVDFPLFFRFILLVFLLGLISALLKFLKIDYSFESPLWCIKVGDRDQALQSLKLIYVFPELEIEKIQEWGELPRETLNSLLCDKKWKRVLGCCLALNLFFQLGGCYFETVWLWENTEKVIERPADKLAICAIYILCFVLSRVFLKKSLAKNELFLGFLVSGLLLGAFTASIWFDEVLISFVICVAYLFFFSFSLGKAVCVLSSGVLEDIGFSLFNFIGFGVFGAVRFGVLLDDTNNIIYVFLAFSVCSFINSVFFYFKGIEVSGSGKIDIKKQVLGF